MDGDGEPAPADSLAKERKKDDTGKEKNGSARKAHLLTVSVPAGLCGQPFFAVPTSPSSPHPHFGFSLLLLLQWRCLWRRRLEDQRHFGHEARRVIGDEQRQRLGRRLEQRLQPHHLLSSKVLQHVRL